MESQEIEKQLLARPLPDLLPADEDWLLPDYQGLSIANLPATVAALLGTDLPGALPPLPRDLWADWLPGLRRVVLVVVDGLGLRLLQRRWAAGDGQALAHLTRAGRLVPLTSVFPSTTNAALTSLFTGYPPAAHGWLAFELYLREWGVAANAIFLNPVWSHQRDMLVSWGLKPEELVPCPTLAQRLQAAGIPSSAVLSGLFLGSGFTTMLYRGTAERRGHRHASDLWVHLRHLLAETRGQRSFISAYWSGLDTLAHAYGPHADQWDAEFRSLCNLLGREFLEPLPSADRQGTLLLVTADHGQIYIPPVHTLTADEDPHLRQHLLVPVMGESRAAFLYPRPGRATALQGYLEDAFPGWFVVRRSAELLKAGLLGQPILDETYVRAGRLMALPRADYALQRSRPKPPLLGRHGGLTADEMLVPLLAARLEALP